MTMKSAVLVPGDGVGPEITDATVKVIEAMGTEIEWQVVEAGMKTMEEYGRPLSPKFFPLAWECGVVLKGPITTPIGKGYRSVNMIIRERLNLYANVRYARSIPGVSGMHDNVDVIIVRENTEGLYVGFEREAAQGVVESIKLTTESASRRIGSYAFELAARMGRGKVTALHKANILKMGDGLFLRTVENVSKTYSGIDFHQMLVDNACHQLVVDPSQFDVIVAQNLYGDIVSDLIAGLVGGLAVMPGANMGDNIAVFEAAHGSAPDIAGKGIANPSGMMLSAALMLDHMRMPDDAARMREAVYAALADKDALTPDMGGKGDTEKFTQAVIDAL